MTPTDDGKLTREEVDALLQATREEDEAPERLEPARRVQQFDFHQPSRFNRSQLEKLRRLNEPLAQNVTRQVARFVRGNVQTQIVSLDQMKWENLCDELGESVVAFVFDLEPTGYCGVVTLDGVLADGLLDRMLGGQGETDAEVVADFTELETRVLRVLVESLLEPLPGLWDRIGPFTVSVGRFVQDLQALDAFGATDDFLQVCLLLQSGAGSGQISVAVPFMAVRDLPPENEATAGAPAGRDEESQAALRESVRRCRIDVRAILGRAEVRVARLINAAPGDVIVLETSIGDALEVQVNNRVKFAGFPGQSAGKLAIKLAAEEW